MDSYDSDSQGPDSAKEDSNHDSPSPSSRALNSKPNYLHSLRAHIEGIANRSIADNNNRSIADNNNERCINMVLGEPDFDRPKFIDDAMVESIRGSKAGYAPMGGLISLRESISRYIKRISGRDYDPISEIIVTAGAKHALALSGRVCTDSQDVIFTQTPTWTGYEGLNELAEGALVPVETSARIISCDDLEQRVRLVRAFDSSSRCFKNLVFDAQTGRRVRAVLVNTPNNPTGAVMPVCEQDRLADFVSDKDIMLISDEVYKSFIFDNNSYRPFCAVPGMRKDKLLFIDSLSKTYNATDLRIGFIAGPAAFIKCVCNSLGNTITCLPKVTQEGAIAALESGDIGDRFVKERVAQYQLRRDRFFDGISSLPGFRDRPQVRPQGAFYAWIDISGFKMGSEEYFQKLLEEGVACAPGKPFGNDNFVRYSLTVRESDYPDIPDVFAEIIARHERFSKKNV